jgi:hypothetical protein
MVVMKINVSEKPKQATNSEMTTEMYRQILEIRNMLNAPDMLDCYAVQRVALSNDFYELISFIDDHRDDYIRTVQFGNK